MIRIIVILSVICTITAELSVEELVEENVPTCSSYDSLCGLHYRYITESGEPIEMTQSQSEICACANNATCNNDWEDDRDSLVQTLLTGGGVHLETKISYCHLPVKQVPCRFGDTVLVTKGHGQFSFELATPVMCKCTRPLVAHSSWSEGPYDFIQYNCGQPRCVKRNMLECASVQLTQAGNFLHTYFCRCRRDEVCIGQLPSPTVEYTMHTCNLQLAPHPHADELKSTTPTE